MIRYSNANGKLQKLQKRIGKRVYSFNLPAGHSCPWALDCFSKADKVTGKITDGPAMKFRCYASSLEALYPSVRKMYHSNYEEIKAFNGNADMISEALLSAMPKKAEVIRIHTSGDFFHASYFQAWIKVALARPDVTFYAYTKALDFWIIYKNAIPKNFRLTASRGGKADQLIDNHNLPESIVIYPDQVATFGHEIDNDDFHAYQGGNTFGLIVHGTQPKKK